MQGASIRYWCEGCRHAHNVYSLCMCFVTSVQAEVKHFMPQDLSNILWACAYSRMLPRSLFEAAAPAVAASVSGFTTQGLTNTAWAYAVAGVHSPTVFGAIAREANKRPIGVFEPRHLAQLLWSMVKAKQVSTHTHTHAHTHAAPAPCGACT